MMSYEDCLYQSETKPNIFTKIANYDLVKELGESYKNENDRLNDNVINKVNTIELKIDALDKKLDTILEYVSELKAKRTSRKRRNAPNSNEKVKDDKILEEGTKIEIKGITTQNKKDNKDVA